VRWVQAVSTAGTVEAKPQGGDTRSHRIEAFSSVILRAVAAQKDISLVELAELLRTEHGASFGASTVWRCLDRHGMTFKKN
jgi:transposase